MGRRVEALHSGATRRERETTMVRVTEFSNSLQAKVAIAGGGFMRLVRGLTAGLGLVSIALVFAGYSDRSARANDKRIRFGIGPGRAGRGPARASRSR